MNTNHTLTITYTGKYYFKRGFFGSLQLYVEIEEVSTLMDKSITYKSYKLANEADLNHFKLNLTTNA